jgi:DNA invertase Pin-like site-specific DNA recombinase
VQTTTQVRTHLAATVAAALLLFALPAEARAGQAPTTRSLATAPLAEGANYSFVTATALWSTMSIPIVAIGLALGAGLALAVNARRSGPGQRPPVAAGEPPQRPAIHRDAPVRPQAEREPRPREGVRVLGYASVPRDAVGNQRGEFEAQLQTITEECRQQGFVLVDVVREHEPERTKSLRRPGLGYALRRIADGEARGLVVADLTRISRSVTDVGEALDWFARAGARLVAAEPRLDTGEQTGQLAANTLIQMSSSQRELLGERTRKGLEAAWRERRRQGRAAVADDPALSDCIAQMRAEGMTLQAIADRLNEEGVPTIRGGAKWRPSSVQAAAGYRRPQQRGAG